MASQNLLSSLKAASDDVLAAGMSPLKMVFDSKKTDAQTPDDADPPPVISKKKEGAVTHDDRIAQLISEVQGRAPPQIAEYIKLAKPVLVPLINALVLVVNFVGPLYFKLGVATYTFLAWLPWDLFRATMGIALCFFGGGYCASIAACEAFAMTGWPVTKRHLEDVYKSAAAVIKAQDADNVKDEDGDGVADVKQITASELVDRKIRVCALAVQEPQQLAAALGGLYTGWLSVQGVLRIKFAMTVNLAVACSQFVEYYVSKALLPILSQFVAKEFVHWLPTVLSSATRAFFVYFAWKLQEVVSAVQSGLRGGLMFSRGLLNWLNKRGVKRLGPFSLEHEHTYLDEAVGYCVAACGFYVQWHLGFAAPFPLNLVLLPLDALEWYIRYSVSTTSN